MTRGAHVLCGTKQGKKGSCEVATYLPSIFANVSEPRHPLL